MGGILSWIPFFRPNPNQIDQPKLFGKLPDPESLSKIEPTLTFFKSTEDDGFELNHLQSSDECLTLIEKNGCFSDPNQKYRLVVITHGFRSDKNSLWLHDTKDTILEVNTDILQQQQVVAILGWGGGADIGLLNYSQAASNCLETGRWLGHKLRQIRDHYTSLQVYGVGHSLGAHLMGMAGRSSPGVLDRITGLDPAGPGFQNENIDKRLNRNDAEMVDVIHTDGQDVPYFGTLVPMGKIDFYPNYGWDQPSNDGSSSAKPMINRDTKNRKIPMPSQYGSYISESHGRAIDFFLWSIQNPRKFRTHLRLEGEPDVEKAVHRVVSMEPELGLEVEMGYHLDSWLEHSFFQQCNSILQPRNSYRKYWANYYIHTNAVAPWC